MAKYLEKKAESLEKLNCNLVSKTVRRTDCQNSGEFMEAHSLYSGFKLLFCHMQIRCTFSLLNYNKLKRTQFVFCYIQLPPLSLTSIIIFSVIQDLRTRIRALLQIDYDETVFLYLAATSK